MTNDWAASSSGRLCNDVLRRRSRSFVVERTSVASTTRPSARRMWSPSGWWRP